MKVFFKLLIIPTEPMWIFSLEREGFGGAFGRAMVECASKNEPTNLGNQGLFESGSVAMAACCSRCPDIACAPWPMLLWWHLMTMPLRSLTNESLHHERYIESLIITSLWGSAEVAMLSCSVCRFALIVLRQINVKFAGALGQMRELWSMIASQKVSSTPCFADHTRSTIR